MRSVRDNLTESESIDSDAGGGYIDIHCHCLPALDDGPATIAEAVSLCKALSDDGIVKVIATPHQLGRFSGCNSAECVRQTIAQFNEELKKNNVSLEILAGGDVRVDERICQLLERDEILTLADGGKYILLELPHEIFIDIEPLIIELEAAGIKSIISHPERHPVLAREHNILYKWSEHSACLQITAASLLGDFGQTAKDAAWKFMESGLTAFCATDAHDLVGRRPKMTAAFESIKARMGREMANLVCIVNPLRVLNSVELEAVYPVGAGEFGNGRRTGDAG